MASTSDIFCGICNAHSVAKHADHWCSECDEGLCSQCQEQYHCISKLSRHHEVIAIENHIKLPRCVLETSNQCQDHHVKYEHYCTFHEALCCPECISTIHRGCVGFLYLREVIKTSKTSAFLINLARTLHDIENNIVKIVKDREENLEKISSQRQRIHDDIKQMRVTINSHLDTLEQQIFTELHIAEEETKTCIKNLLTQLSNEKSNVNELQNSITAVREYTSDLQTFLGSKVIERKIEKYEKYLKSLDEEGNLQQIELVYTSNVKLNEILTAITAWGSIGTVYSTPLVQIQTEKDKEPQIMSLIQQLNTKSINDINIQLQTSINMPKSKRDLKISGCCVLPNGRMVFADNRRLVVMTDKGTLDKEMPCINSGPYDVTVMDDRTVAVSTGLGVEIINIETGRVEKQIKTSKPCCGISLKKCEILFCEESKGICTIQLPGGNITTLVKQDNMPLYAYLASYHDKIYQTNGKTKTVTCYTMKGEKVWEYKDESILKDPTGITVDSDGNLFVASYNNNSVVVLSSNGKQGRLLLGEKDGIMKPGGIYFDSRQHSLLVANCNSGVVFLYNVSLLCASFDISRCT